MGGGDEETPGVVGGVVVVGEGEVGLAEGVDFGEVEVELLTQLFVVAADGGDGGVDDVAGDMVDDVRPFVDGLQQAVPDKGVVGVHEGLDDGGPAGILLWRDGLIERQVEVAETLGDGFQVRVGEEALLFGEVLAGFLATVDE